MPPDSPPARQRVDLPHLRFAGMSQAIRHGQTVTVSGQVALGPDGAVVGEGDIRVQAEQCFANLEGVLHAAGAAPRDVVKLTCFLVNGADYPGYAEVKAARFGDVAPASTCVVVAALLDPRLLLEVEAVAVVAD